MQPSSEGARWHRFQEAVARWWRGWTRSNPDSASCDCCSKPSSPAQSGSREAETTPQVRAGKWPSPGNLPHHLGCCALLLVIMLSWLADPVRAQSPEASVPNPAAQRGLTFVRTNCARCHSIDSVTDSPLKIAPPFRTLHLKYPVENLAEAFAEGISTGHPTMPEFRLDPGQIGDLLAFLKTLEH
jgi:mono/diheme cytochrome c family protein